MRSILTTAAALTLVAMVVATGPQKAVPGLQPTRREHGEQVKRSG